VVENRDTDVISLSVTNGSAVLVTASSFLLSAMARSYYHSDSTNRTVID
jgi:hypothetical protein